MKEKDEREKAKKKKKGKEERVKGEREKTEPTFQVVQAEIEPARAAEQAVVVEGGPADGRGVDDRGHFLFSFFSPFFFMRGFFCVFFRRV